MESQWATKALEQGRVTPDMKWMDIKIKDLRTKINDQSVEDAKKGLEKTGQYIAIQNFHRFNKGC